MLWTAVTPPYPIIYGLRLFPVGLRPELDANPPAYGAPPANLLAMLKVLRWTPLLGAFFVEAGCWSR